MRTHIEYPVRATSYYGFTGFLLLCAMPITGAAKFGAFFGTFIGGAFMLRYGRKRAIAFNSIFFVVGPLVMSASWNSG